MSKTIRRTDEVSEREFRAARREAADFSRGRTAPEPADFDTLTLAYAGAFAALSVRRPE